MNDQRLMAYYYPTTVLLIDDNQRYLLGIKSGLNKKKASYALYNDPTAALNFLTHEYQADLLAQRCISSIEEEERDHRTIDVNISVINKEIFNPDRFNQVSVIVIDQEMPGMKGLDLCKKISNSSIKKLMLTGEATNEQAIDAFNNGVIDRFINKNSDNFNQILNDTVFELQQEYFKDLSATIISSIIHNYAHHPLSCLDDPVFIEHFNHLCQKHQFCEYYLADANGSFMFIDFNGKPSWLVVKDEQAMHATEFDAEVSDIKLPNKTMNSLKNREKVLYLHNDDDWFVTADEWEAHGFLHPVKRIEGNKQHYYLAYVDNPTTYSFEPNTVFSFKSHIEKTQSSE